MRFLRYASLLGAALIYLLVLNWHVLTLANLTQGLDTEIIVDNETYQIKNGNITKNSKTIVWIFDSQNRAAAKKVFSLALFYRLTYEEPLFVHYAFPTEEFKKALTNLEAMESLVLQETNTKEYFIPITFLKSLPEVVQREKIFFAKPTIDNAQDLIKAYRKSSTLYKEHARKSLLAIEKTTHDTIGEDKEIRLVELANVTTSGLILQDYEKIIDNADAIDKEINKRQACLQNGNCNASKNLTKKIVNPSESKQSLLPKDILFPNGTKKEVRGPYTASSSCFETKDTIHRFFLITEENALTVKLGTNNFYRKLQERYPQDKILMDQGLTWVFQPETNTYTCPNLEYLATLSEIDYTYHKRKAILPQRIPVTTPVTVQEQLRKAAAVEDAFFNARVPSEATLYELGSTYYDTYQSLKIWKKTLPHDTFIQSFDDTVLIDTALAILYKTSAYPLLINKIANELELLYQRRTLFESRFNMIYLHGIRSSYSLTYLVFSPGTWVSSAKPAYLLESKHDAFGWNKRYITYKQLREKYSEEEIKTWHNKQKQEGE